MSDARTAYVLAKEFNRRMLIAFGVHPEDVNFATIVIGGMVLEASHRNVKRITTRPSRPDRYDGLFGLGVSDELVHGLAGPASRKAPYFGALVAVGVAVGLSGPVVRGAARDIRSATQRAGSEFHHRYGYLIAARARRAARRTAWPS